MTDHVDEPKAIQFSEAGQPAKINYQVPLPGAHTGRRIMELDLGLNANDFTSLAKSAGTSYKDSLGVDPKVKDKLLPNDAKVKNFLSDSIHRISTRVTRLPENIKPERAVIEDNKSRTTASPQMKTIAALNEAIDPNIFKESILSGVVMVPTVGWAGNLTYTPHPVESSERPKIFLVERYGISSFLGDYGMGKTVKTFTLLPGETTRISMRTWQSTKESRQESSSIIDSHEQSARERFADKIQNETTDKQTKSKTEEWHVEAEVSASWGFGSASVSGGGSGEYSSGREQFAKQAAESVKEHAAESSSKREMSVTSSSEREEESGSETIIERTISNANMRRVLNFVFRELNQEYITKLHLKDVRVAFTNGRRDSWREVPISGLLGFLDEFVVNSKIPQTARAILKIAGFIADSEDVMVPTLERVNLVDHGTRIEITPATLDEDGEFPVPTSTSYYRFKSGPLRQEEASNPVDGVLLNDSRITMRTDSVIVEALLGQADALDEYAMSIQRAAANKETLANERERIVQTAIAEAKLEDRLETIVDLNRLCATEPVE
ncbi:hypothetical protein [Microbulbifer hydrolyticus]|uniref:Uncharacterized protein n=1 Tax=Microbulbifer hydrolyticus TaxID=48074 RepID=A0A6P1T9U0_9GAMM|nr:hypothetical protein [Microbulbifer hydrolyticus]MBB5211222.1 hypothetical protein [Microbulbifer hydrolyticus]QHQ38009.1 hypothetical protein GTQ55_02665 [Microbulbifer hydrolyticus]